MVKLRSVPPESEPSIVTLSVPLKLIKPLTVGDVPEIVRAAPFGLIKTVKPPASSFKTTAPVSPAKLEVMLIVMLPVAPAALIAEKMPPGLVSEVKVSAVPTL